ncbi:MAG: hypothetical protein KUG65_04870 [Sphingomonadaceae bacterium]|nr:hypothetical protein [Sphingomonadaceae bacterium]
MTSRLLLTLLAILTGLSAQGSAVQARALTATSTQVAAVCALATVRGAKASAEMAMPFDLAVFTIVEPGRFDVLTRAAVAVPAYLIRVDRAHE